MNWQAERILAVRLDTLGDVLMTGPAVRALGQGGAEVTLLTSSRGEAAANLLDVEVMTYDAPWLKATGKREDSGPDLGFIQTLRSHRFDAAVIFTTYTQNPLPTALTLYLADIPLRLAHCRENPYQLLTHWVRDREEVTGVRHEVRRQLDLVASVGYSLEDEQMRVSIPEAARRKVDEVLRPLDLPLSLENWLVVHPGASAQSRRYPPEKFAAVCDRLARSGLQIVFTGSQNERELIAEIQARMAASSYDLAGRLELPQLAALLERAPLLLANNTGPVHLAAAVGTPVVDLYALTNPQHTPWGVPCHVLYEDVPCRFCLKSVCPEGHNGCLHWVTPECVVAAVLELLGTSPSPNYLPITLDPEPEPVLDSVREEVKA